jgi:hypothetical protein
MDIGPEWLKVYLSGVELTFGVVAFDGVEVVLSGATVLFADFWVADSNAHKFILWDWFGLFLLLHDLNFKSI